MATGSTLTAAKSAADLRPQFNPELFDFLMKVHLAGGNPDVGDIYGDYNCSLLQPSEPDDNFWDGQLVILLKGLSEIGDDCLYVQTTATGLPGRFNLKANYARYAQHTEVEDGVLALDELLFFVYWFAKENAPDSEKRVYIHLANPCAAPGIAVLKALVPKLKTVPGFDKVKMFGPSQGEDRNDNIVVYCSTAAAQKEIASIAKALPPNLLQADIPRWVKQVAPGIGVADEPPGVELFHGDSSKQSFGKFLSKLIYLAWTHNKSKTDFEFLSLVRIAMETAGMDPLKPHKHSRKAEVEAMQPGLAERLERALSSFKMA